MILVSSVMLGLAVTTIHLLLRAERHSMQAVWQRTTLARLSRVLRDDVHAAVEAEAGRTGNDPAGLNLRLAGGEAVTYQVEDHTLTRIRLSGEKETGREVFYLPPGSTWRFETTEEASPRVQLIVRRPNKPIAGAGGDSRGQDGTEGRRTMSIEAVPGRDHRFAELQ